MKTRTPSNRNERIVIGFMLASGAILVLYAVIVSVAGPLLHH